MKKGLIFATTLAMALGVGVAVGAHQKEVAKADAYGPTDATWYLCHEGNSWSKNSAADHFTYSKNVGNNWEFETDNYIQLSKDEKFNIVYSWNDGAGWNTFTPNLMTDQSEETVFTVPDGTDYAVAARDIKVKFFFQVYGEGATWTGLYWEEYQEPAADPVYTIVNRENAPVTFVLDEDEKPAGVKHQYSAEVQFAKRGGDLKFYADGVEITSGIGVDWDSEQEKPVAGNNVYGDVTNGFYLAHTVNYTGLTKIYLKTYEDGGISLWANGYQNNEFYSYIKDGQGSGQNVTLTLDTTFEPDETYIRQYKTSSAVAIKALAGTNWDTSFSLDCSGLGEDVAPEAGATNNARQAFQSSAWKVHNDCNEVIYVKERKTDLALFLYVGGYEEAVVVTIGGQEIALSKDGDEYVAHGVDLSAGDSVTAFTIEGEASEVTSKKVANNNLSEGKVVIADVEDADIYYNIANKNLWISGLPEGGQHLLVNGKTAIAMTHTDPYEGYDQYASGMLEFKANDTIKVLNTGVEDSYAVVWCPDIVATSEALKDKFVYDSEKDEMKCTADCSAAVYLKIKSGVDEVYFGDVPEYVEEAVEYVNGFKAAMATACSAEGKKAAVEAAWAAQATAYAALSEQARAEVYKGGFSLVDEIQEFGERYIAIKQQHSDWTLENFLEWDIPASPRFGGMEFASDANISTIVIVISIAAVSTLAFTMLLVFKKRKQK